MEYVSFSLPTFLISTFWFIWANVHTEQSGSLIQQFIRKAIVMCLNRNSNYFLLGKKIIAVKPLLC